MPEIRIVDSHTEGEPTRTIVAGAPPLGVGPLAERRERFRREYDWLRTAVVTEPRASEAAVGALLVPAVDRSARTGVIFFNNAGYLGMCGHGTIGVVASLAYLGTISPGRLTVETPVGAVDCELRGDGAVSFRNVESRCARRGVSVEVPGFGRATGDVAWGGNWFFLIDDPPVAVERRNLSACLAYARAVRAAIDAAGVVGDDGGQVDHVELSVPTSTSADSRNFVLCPGGMYDRSPCGTGTSARLAVLAARGALRPGQRWRQEGILGGVFEATAEPTERGVIPTISGRAFVTAVGELVVDDRDPFRFGIPPP